MYIYGRPLITYDLIARGREAIFFSLFERHPLRYLLCYSTTDTVRSLAVLDC